MRYYKVQMSKIGKYLSSENSLSQEIGELLIAHKEEDSHLDYKQEPNIDTDKSWLELTKDITAFANTEGGYFVFGILDKKSLWAFLKKSPIY